MRFLGNYAWGGHGGPPLQLRLQSVTVGVALRGHPYS